VKRGHKHERRAAPVRISVAKPLSLGEVPLGDWAEVSIDGTPLWVRPCFELAGALFARTRQTAQHVEVRRDSSVLSYEPARRAASVGGEGGEVDPVRQTCYQFGQRWR
jgi:hypothetical protein